MGKKQVKIIITKEELYALGFEKVIYKGKEYVDKGPLFLDSTCPLSLAYWNLVERKTREARKRDTRREHYGSKKK